MYTAKKYGEGFETKKYIKKNEGEWTEKVEVRTRNRLLAVGEACLAIV